MTKNWHGNIGGEKRISRFRHAYISVGWGGLHKFFGPSTKRLDLQRRNSVR